MRLARGNLSESRFARLAKRKTDRTALAKRDSGRKALAKRKTGRTALAKRKISRTALAKRDSDGTALAKRTSVRPPAVGRRKVMALDGKCEMSLLLEAGCPEFERIMGVKV